MNGLLRNLLPLPIAHRPTIARAGRRQHPSQSCRAILPYFLPTRHIFGRSSSTQLSMSHSTALHLRAESKRFEHRCCITPSVAKQLLSSGYQLFVERSSSSPDTCRIFRDDEYESIGATLVPGGSWKEAPSDRIIIGLKELPEETFPLDHVMVHFAHCYKKQNGWEKVLGRFAQGSGLLYDLEFLQDETGRRVAAFGFHAGYAGAALALKAWIWGQSHPDNPALPPVQSFTDGRGYFGSEQELLAQLQADLQDKQVGGKKPRVMIIGAEGRSGRGAVDLLLKAGVPEQNVVRWDLNETKDRDGPYPEIIDSDIFINAIYLTRKIPPFITRDSANKQSRRLTVLCDVSCDPDSPNNPIPLYSHLTYFDKPTLQVELDQGPALSIIAIDHFPSLLPREASEAFSTALAPILLQLKDLKAARVWTDAEKLFHEKVQTLPAQYQKN